MKRLGLALAALAALVIGAAPLPALAADKSKDAAPIPKDARASGMKDAPALVQAASVPCTVTDAYLAGKSGKSNAYEVACKEGMGYIVIGGAGGAKPEAFDCLLALKTNACKLPANADPKASLQPLLAQSGRTCQVKDARGIGATPSGQRYYEVSCQEGGGFILQTPATGSSEAATAIPCAAQIGAQLECTLTTKADIIASLSRTATASGKACPISDVAYLGSDPKSGDTYYELACGKQAGYVLATDKAGGYKTSLDCGKAASVGLTCKMTDATVVQSEENGTYTGLAKAGGFNCTVAKYRFIGMTGETSKNEVVELACSNRPDGVVAVFPSDSKAKAQFIDCVRSGQFGDNAACKLTSPAPVYAKYTQALAAKGRTSCKVSGARYLGRSGSGTDFIETACADGAPGYVIEMSPTDAVVSLLSCGQAKSAGVACKLPTNLKP